MLLDHKYAPTVSLKKTGSSTLSIPPHQQKLTVGSTVLEDWDEDCKVLLLCNYPSITELLFGFILSLNIHTYDYSH